MKLPKTSKRPTPERVAEILAMCDPNRDRRDFGRLPNEYQRELSVVLEAYAAGRL